MSTLEVVDNSRPVAGELVYVVADHAFDFRPSSPDDIRRLAGGSGTTSLLIGTLQIEVGIDTGMLLYPWGYLPRVGWMEGSLPRVRTRAAGLRLASVRELIRGVSIDLLQAEPPRTIFDPSSGRVCLQAGSFDDTLNETIEFADGAAVSLRNGHIAAVWLHPSFEAAA